MKKHLRFWTIKVTGYDKGNTYTDMIIYHFLTTKEYFKIILKVKKKLSKIKNFESFSITTENRIIF